MNKEALELAKAIVVDFEDDHSNPNEFETYRIAKAYIALSEELEEVKAKLERANNEIDLLTEYPNRGRRG